jgi:hypothetical protein
MVDSCLTARKIRRDRWWYIQYQSDLQAAYKEMDETADEVFGKSDDEEDITSSATVAPCHHDHEANTSAGVAGSEEE